MPTISERLNAISKSINNITKEASQAAKETKSITSSLRFDPTNLNLIVQRFAAMKNEIEINRKRVAALKDAITQLESIRAGTTDTAQIEKINKLLDDYRVKIDYAERAIDRLNQATTKQAQAQAIVSAATQKAEDKFSKLEKGAQRLSLVLIAGIAIITRYTAAIVQQGQQLYSLSQRYNTTVENIQTMNRALQLATGESDLFTQSLKFMVQGMAQVASGRGVAYQNALRQIGISYSQIAGLDTTEQFNMIVEGLSNIANASDRAALAQTLLGESGQYISSILSQDADAMDDYIEQAKGFGVLTQEQAKALNELNLQFEQVKSQLGAAFAEVVIALAPALESIADIITNYLAPAIKDLGEWFDGLSEPLQMIVLALPVILVFLPKILGLIKFITTGINAFSAATKTATVATTMLNLATSQWQIVLLAVAAVIIGIISLIGLFSKKAKQASDDLTQLVNNASSLAGAGTDFTATTEANTTSTTQRTITLNADIYGHGDTAISDEAAATVAELTASEINKQLGDLIK